MNPPRNNNESRPDSWSGFEPYLQLVRSLLPRAGDIALFDATGEMRWSSETATGPDLPNIVDDALETARTNPQRAGLLRMLDGNLPAYLCWLRDDAERLLAVVAVVCRPNAERDVEVRSFSFARALLRPALECLRRDLVARVAIRELKRAVSALDKDLELLLAGRALSFAINFSGQSLNDEEFADLLLDRIGASGLDLELFCFELTENATIASLARAGLLLRRLRRLGCGVALDDFGTGLSSLAYLRQLPVTMLKIDGSFVRDILKDPRAESMVRAIAQLARSMSIATVAEYVETEEIRTRITALGVDYGQRFAIGKPAPLTELLTELPVLAAAHTTPCPASDTVVEPRADSFH